MAVATRLRESTAVTDTEGVDDAVLSPVCDTEGERLLTVGETVRETAGEAEMDTVTLSVTETDTVGEARGDDVPDGDAARVRLVRAELEYEGDAEYEPVPE